MEYQMQNFINTTAALCEYTFLEGGSISRSRPDPFLVARGFKPPYKSWQRANYPYPFMEKQVLADGNLEPVRSLCQVNSVHIEGSLWHLIEFLNSQDEPFDGFAAFSQGMAFLLTFFDA